MNRRRSSLLFDAVRPGGSKSLADIYAAHGAVPDAKPIAVPNDMMWWDEERVAATVDREYVLSHLRPDEARRLDQQLEFGDGLTDDTYLEWIETKAKRIFLTLVDIGVPDQIFGVVDDSWDDEDLPISLDQVERLQLRLRKDERLDKKFFHRQFTYLLRHLRPGENLIYEDVELIPLELVDKRPVAGVVGLSQNTMDKVCIPGRPDDIFFRRRIALGNAPGQVSEADFLSGIEKMRARHNQHIVSLWASYIHQSAGYLLLTPVHEGTLKSALTALPPSIKILAKEVRRVLLLDWMHCLTEAVVSLHKQGLHHGHIKPSNILLNSDNKIFLSDSSAFTSNQMKHFDKETYDYGAPELSRLKTETCHSFGHQSRNPSGARRPTTISSPSTSPALSFSTISPKSPSHMDTAFINKRYSPLSPPSSPPPPLDPLRCDIYSLGCIYLELLTILLKRSSKAFSSHRSAKNKTAGRGGGLPDSSFQKNPGQVEAWTFALLKDARKKEDRLFRGVSHLLSLITKMLSPNPSDRPSAELCEERIYDILTKNSGIEKTHCGSATMWRPRDSVIELEGSTPSVVIAEGSTSQNWSRPGSYGSVSTSHSNTGNGNRSSSAGALGHHRQPLSKPRPWKAPVYAGEYDVSSCEFPIIALCPSDLLTNTAFV